HTRCYRDWSSDVCSSDLGHVHGGDGVRHSVSRIVNPDVDSVVVMESEAEDALDLLAIAYVAGQSERALGVADAAAGRFGAAGIAGEQNNARTVVGKCLCNGLTNANR